MTNKKWTEPTRKSNLKICLIMGYVVFMDYLVSCNLFRHLSDNVIMRYFFSRRGIAHSKVLTLSII